MKKHGYTLIEVVVSIAIIAILASSLYYILGFLGKYQIDKEDKWRAYKLVENTHALYLNDPTFFINQQSLYFDYNLNLTVKDKAYFTIEYTITIDNGVCEMYVTKVSKHNGDILIKDVSLGKWVVPNET